MKVTPASNQVQQVKHPRLRAARNGALITTGLLAASTGYNWAKRTDVMRKTVKEVGGTKNYLKTLALGVSILAAGGALLNTVVSAIADRIVPKKPPKAAN